MCLLVKIAFIDCEVSKSGRIVDFGAHKEDETNFHKSDVKEFFEFVKKSDFLCGHNIIKHDCEYLKKYSSNFIRKYEFIDTLPVAPLLFPKKPYHALLKDDIILNDDLNNPLSDAIKAKELFYSEIDAFNLLNNNLKSIFGTLLYKEELFSGFFKCVKWAYSKNIVDQIKMMFKDKICYNANLKNLVKSNPIELAYCLALINVNDKYSITPAWVENNYPDIDTIMNKLRGIKCKSGCPYCDSKFELRSRLKEFFNYDDFRKFNGEDLQLKAVSAAVEKKSILAVFPTGGGKSLTFQLPALISGETSKALTIVISPLQSLMKDQVYNLEQKGIVNAVTINGLLSPLERKEAIERVKNGIASLLYISPESLRSKNLESIIMGRNIERVVIDEAHCFSAWGQDFRVDYLYIAKFIKRIQELKNDKQIPISCFTATAKQKVIADIMGYFKEHLDLDLELYATSATRKNLMYHVIKINKEDKYQRLRELITEKNCPTIVYVSRTSTSLKIADALVRDGFSALAYNGRMNVKDKQLNQESFINNETQIIVATSAFGMGVDKSDVGLVVHYEISDSLENYVQEAGRAGRNEHMQADCYVLFDEEDLDGHFSLLHRSKLTLNDIQQVWSAIKKITTPRNTVYASALEIAREAGWDQSIRDIETRVKTAINAIEIAGYIKRGYNSPRVYATSIEVKNSLEAMDIINNSKIFENDEDRGYARLIISKMMGTKSRADAGNDEAESRVDYLADITGIDKYKVIEIVDKLRNIKVLADSQDMGVYILKTDTYNKSEKVFLMFQKLERYLSEHLIKDDTIIVDLKELNDNALREGIKSTKKNIIAILNFWKNNGYITANGSVNERSYEITPLKKKEEIINNIHFRFDIASETIRFLFEKESERELINEALVKFSMTEVISNYNDSLIKVNDAKYKDMKATLLYLNQIRALHLQGGFLVFYSPMQIQKLVDNKIKYKKEDYKNLEKFYRSKTEQIHIVGMFANMMCSNIEQALEYVHDYFHMEYSEFINTYFKNDPSISIPLTSKYYKKIFKELSPIQNKIINDKDQYISVVAGPGSGKTRLLVHKLASLLTLEDVKAEQLLMLTFSRAAASEFKTRLINLIGQAANYVDIKTFHSYCFDLLGKLGNKEEFDQVIPSAIELIKNDEVEQNKIAKTVLVIDEAQDIDSKEYELIETLIERNEDMRVIFVGDDDQNVYEFRGSDSKYMSYLINKHNAKKYEMLDNYRSVNKIVNLSNSIGSKIKDRLKHNAITSIKNENGLVAIVKHVNSNMEQAIVNQIIKYGTQQGKIAILTRTNEESYRVLGLLLKNKIDAKLIQDNDGFKLSKLIEVSYFLNLVNSEDELPIISEERWNMYLDKLKQRYYQSNLLPLILNMLNKFASLSKVKYKTDLFEFIYESNLDDFTDSDDSDICVSTIHKSKGKEFDTVYILSNDIRLNNDREIRKMYVGVTRAKKNLIIHYYGDTFDEYQKANYINFIYDNTEYKYPDELVINLNHKKVYLGYFKNNMSFIKSLRSGFYLQSCDDGLIIKGDKYPILKYSKAFLEELNVLKANGFKVEKAKVRYIVNWKDSKDVNSEEIPIILPTLYLKQHIQNDNVEIFDDTSQYVDIEIEEENEEKANGLEGFELIYAQGKCKTDVELLIKLRSLRNTIAKEEKVRAYIVLSNAALVQLATYKPISKEGFISLHGLGPYKYEKYGKRFIEEILKNS